VQVKASTKTGQGTPARLMIPLALTHGLLQTGSEQGTNGSAFLGSENTSFPQEFRFDFQGNIGLHICTYLRAPLLGINHNHKTVLLVRRKAPLKISSKRLATLSIIYIL